MARIALESDPQAEETWLELTIQELWDSVKRVRKRRGPRQETHQLTFGTAAVEIVVRRLVP